MFRSLLCLGIAIGWTAITALPCCVARASELGDPIDLNAATLAASEPISGYDDPDVMSVRLRGVPESLWNFGVGTAILTRGTLAGSPIMIERFPNTGNVFFKGSDYRFDWAAGPDISGVRRLAGDRFFDAVDFRYFDVQSISSTAGFTPPLIWGYPTDGSSSFVDERNVETQYVSQLYSFEVNGRRELGDSGVAFLSGFRWIQADDAMGFVSTSANGSTISHNWNTNNNLYGFQIGAFVPLIASQSPWSLSASPKIGIYGNQCLSQWNDGVPAGTIQNTNSIFRNQVAFAGELSATLGYRVSKRCTLQAGYQLLWLNGIGVAADQAAVLSADSIATGLNSSGSAFYHGALAGVNFAW